MSITDNKKRANRFDCLDDDDDNEIVNEITNQIANENKWTDVKQKKNSTNKCKETICYKKLKLNPNQNNYSQKIIKNSFKIIKETYEEYKEFISNRNFDDDKWAYDIIDEIAEKDKIIYRDDKIVIVPNYLWNGIDIEKMHLLVFPTDKTIHSIRDLTDKNIELLEHSQQKTLDIIKSKYGFDPEDIKAYFHYAPSTYHLHIHFLLITNKYANSSVEYSHELSTVIEILKVKTDFYQKIAMNKKIFLTNK